jgi:hypothetical protein
MGAPAVLFLWFCAACLIAAVTICVLWLLADAIPPGRRHRRRAVVVAWVVPCACVAWCILAFAGEQFAYRALDRIMPAVTFFPPLIATVLAALWMLWIRRRSAAA